MTTVADALVEKVETPAVVDAPEPTPVVRSSVKIAEAICAVMTELERLKKADHNKFANYDFTSVDDFKDEIRPLMALNGLYLHATQASLDLKEVRGDKDKISTVALFDFDLTLKHVCGEAEPPVRMSVLLPITGAQTSGAARSYAIKEWMKSSFLASSGAPADVQEEADMMDQSREGLRMNKADARDTYKKLTDEMREVEKARDYLALAAWWDKSRDIMGTLPKDWFLTIKNDYAKTYVDLKASADLDRMSNDELDALAQRRELAQHPISAG